MGSLVDLLLASDASKIRELPKAKIKIERLSKIIGADFEIEIRALTQKEMTALPEGEDGINHKIIAGITNIDFRNADLRAKFKSANRDTPLTPAEVVDVLFLVGEKVQIAKLINEISGFGEDMVEKIEKN